MAQLTVRRLDADLVRRLKLRAARHDRSAEAEHRAILEEALRPEAVGFWERAAALRRTSTGRGGSDSVEILREQRRRDDALVGEDGG